MLRIDLSHAKPGMKLALGVNHPRQRGHMLLKGGYELTHRSIARLSQLDIKHVWLHFASLDFLQELVDPRVIAAHGQVVGHIADALKAAKSDSAAKLPFDVYGQSVRHLISTLVQYPRSTMYLGDLFDTGGDPLLLQSATVTYLGLILGLRLEGYLVKERKRLTPGRATDLAALGTGAMFHDLGVVCLNEEVRRRYLASGDDSDPQWREHPRLGYEMLRGHVEPSAATCVLHHHQRCDGSGYAGHRSAQLDGHRIHVFARIIGLVEQFVRLCHPPSAAASPAQPTIASLCELIEPSMLAKFDPQIVRALLAVVPPYPPGQMVQLNDDRWAVCIDHNPNDPCRPVVRIVPSPQELAPDELPELATIDLSKQDGKLCVSGCDGRDVTDLNFAMPDLDRAGFIEVALVRR